MSSVLTSSRWPGPCPAAQGSDPDDQGTPDSYRPHTIRGARVILDTDLARLYGVETRALNQAVKRNRKKFPPDFMFELEREEIAGISQTVTSLGKLRFSKQVHAFAEHGALMAATLLNSPRAVAMSVYIIGFHVRENAVPYRSKPAGKKARQTRLH